MTFRLFLVGDLNPSKSPKAKKNTNVKLLNHQKAIVKTPKAIVKTRCPITFRLYPHDSPLNPLDVFGKISHGIADFFHEIDVAAWNKSH